MTSDDMAVARGDWYAENLANEMRKYKLQQEAEAASALYSPAEDESFTFGRAADFFSGSAFPAPALYIYAEEAPVIEGRWPEGYNGPVEFRITPMDDPLKRFEHGVWYRIEVVDGKPTIRKAE